MKTIVYISRHSLTLKTKVLNENQSIFIQNIQTPLSVKGEENAKKLSEYIELSSVDAVYSSNYTRAISTAKYIANKNNLNVIVDYRFGERLHGVKNDYSELPYDFEMMQLKDENYKYGEGESRKEVTERMRAALFDAVNTNAGKTIYITSHSTAMMDLFISFGYPKIEDGRFSIIVNDIELLNSDFEWNTNSPELFKLDFEDDRLVNINYVKW